MQKCFLSKQICLYYITIRLIYQLKTRYNINMKNKNPVNGASKLKKYVCADSPDTYAEALKIAVNMLCKRKSEQGFNPERKYLLFVPDKYTLLAEKLLYASGGAFDAEVLTVNRLCFKLADYEGKPAEERPLSRLGAVLTVRRILNENKDKLVCFNKSAGFAGFGEIMYDNICQIASSGLRSRDLPDLSDESVTSYKLRDLKLVYSEYEKATDGKYVDATGRLLLLEKMLAATDYFKGASVYFACYDGFTPLSERLVGRICELSDSAVIVNAVCKLNLKAASVEEYEAPTRADELKAAAVRICNLAKNGARYGDVGVIALGADYNRLKRIFEEYGIPFFTDVKYALSSHPLARYILELFKTARAETNENYITLAKNPYSGISPNDADIFENYVYYCALKEGSMRFPFTLEPDGAALKGKLNTAESVRERLVASVRAARLSDVKTGGDFCRAIIKAVPSREAEITAEFNTAIANPLAEIVAAAEVLAEVFPSPTNVQTLFDALEEGFSLKEVSVLPNLSDTVEVGETSVFRASGKKYMFVLGMHDGELPCVKRDDGILSDRDLETIAEFGDKRAVIEPSIEALNARSEQELASVLSSCDELFLSYITGEAPSPFLERIKSECRKKKTPEKITGFELERELLASGERKAELLAMLCPTPASALELCLIGNGEIAAGGDGFGFERELAAAVGGLPENVGREITVPQAGKLYRRRISISRVQEYFSCPFRCFLRYGLKLEERPDGKVSALELGTFLHRVIELFISRGDFSSPKTAVEKIVKEILENEPRILKGASESFIGELTEEAAGISAVAASQLMKGSFEAKFTEAAFGKPPAPFKGHEIVLDADVLTAEGVIDRVDVCGNAARVIDYKTGHAEFSLADIYYGKKIQLPVYLKVLQENGFAPAGMFYFPFSTAFASDKNSYRLMGMFDEKYAYEMDNGLGDEGYASNVVNARAVKGSAPYRPVLHKAGSSAVCGDTLGAVCDYAEAVLKSGAEEMLSGYCAPSPLVSGRLSECSYCEMKPVCAACGGKLSERKKSAVKAAFIQEVISKRRDTSDLAGGSDVL